MCCESSRFYEAYVKALVKRLTWNRPVICFLGVNTVTTLVENKKAQLVVIAHDVDPIEVSTLHSEVDLGWECVLEQTSSLFMRTRMLMHAQSFPGLRMRLGPCNDVWISSPESTMKSKMSFLTLSNCHHRPAETLLGCSVRDTAHSLSLFSWWSSCQLCAARWECHTASSRARPGWGDWCTGKLVPVLLSPKLTRKYSVCWFASL